MSAGAHVIATRDAYERYAEAYAHHRSDRTAVGPFIERFVALLPAAPWVLDVGSGPGVDTGSLVLRGVQTVALDIAVAMLEMAAPHAGGRVVHADQRRLPFAGASFDDLWANACLLHLARHEAGGALAEIARVLKRGGLLYTAMQLGSGEALEPPGMGTGGVQAPRFFARYAADEWLALLRRAGFQPLPPVESADNLSASKLWLNCFARRT